MRFHRLPIALGATLLGLALLPGLALADAMTYPGSICELAGRADGNYIRRSYQGAFNDHYLQTDRDVICPIVRKNPYTTAGVRRIKVRLKRKSWASARASSCQVVSRDIRGRPVYTSPSQRTTRSGITEFYFGIPSSGYKGSFEVRCTLPYATGVVGYLVDEY